MRTNNFLLLPIFFADAVWAYSVSNRRSGTPIMGMMSAAMSRRKSPPRLSSPGAKTTLSRRTSPLIGLSPLQKKDDPSSSTRAALTELNAGLFGLDFGTIIGLGISMYFFSQTKNEDKRTANDETDDSWGVMAKPPAPLIPPPMPPKYEGVSLFQATPPKIPPPLPPPLPKAVPRKAVERQPLEVIAELPKYSDLFSKPKPMEWIPERKSTVAARTKPAVPSFPNVANGPATTLNSIPGPSSKSTTEDSVKSYAPTKNYKSNVYGMMRSSSNYLDALAGGAKVEVASYEKSSVPNPFVATPQSSPPPAPLIAKAEPPAPSTPMLLQSFAPPPAARQDVNRVPVTSYDLLSSTTSSSEGKIAEKKSYAPSKRIYDTVFHGMTKGGSGYLSALSSGAESEIRSYASSTPNIAPSAAEVMSPSVVAQPPSWFPQSTTPPAAFVPTPTTAKINTASTEAKPKSYMPSKISYDSTIVTGTSSGGYLDSIRTESSQQNPISEVSNNPQIKSSYSPSKAKYKAVQSKGGYLDALGAGVRSETNSNAPVTYSSYTPPSPTPDYNPFVPPSPASTLPSKPVDNLPRTGSVGASTNFAKPSSYAPTKSTFKASKRSGVTPGGSYLDSVSVTKSVGSPSWQQGQSQFSPFSDGGGSGLGQSSPSPVDLPNPVSPPSGLSYLNDLGASDSGLRKPSSYAPTKSSSGSGVATPFGGSSYLTNLSGTTPKSTSVGELSAASSNARSQGSASDSHYGNSASSFSDVTKSSSQPLPGQATGTARRATYAPTKPWVSQKNSFSGNSYLDGFSSSRTSPNLMGGSVNSPDSNVPYNPSRIVADHTRMNSIAQVPESKGSAFTPFNGSFQKSAEGSTSRIDELASIIKEASPALNVQFNDESSVGATSIPAVNGHHEGRIVKDSIASYNANGSTNPRLSVNSHSSPQENQQQSDASNVKKSYSPTKSDSWKSSRSSQVPKPSGPHSYLDSL